MEKKLANTGSGEGAYEETIRLIILGPLVTLLVKTSADGTERQYLIFRR